MSRRYRNKLQEYLLWRVDNFLRPADLPIGAVSPEECMLNWESKGSVPVSTTVPATLASYIQGKQCRDWHITEWREGIRQGLFKPEEFIGTLGLENYIILCIQSKS